jgi:hypothetical protein
MGIFRKGEGAEFDDSVYYADDPAELHAATVSARNPLKFGIITFISVLGIAYGANLALNVGNNNRIEYGQGFQTVLSCQPSSPITVTPYAGFINQTGTGKFTLDSILLENVHQNCVNDDFTIRLYSNTDQTPLTLSETATSVGVYQGFQEFRFWWQDSVTVTAMSRQYTDVELLNDTSDATDFNANQTAFLITFDPDQVASFADARDVFKITLETNNHLD